MQDTEVGCRIQNRMQNNGAGFRIQKKDAGYRSRMQTTGVG